MSNRSPDPLPSPSTPVGDQRLWTLVCRVLEPRGRPDDDEPGGRSEQRPPAWRRIFLEHMRSASGTGSSDSCPGHSHGRIGGGDARMRSRPTGFIAAICFAALALSELPTAARQGNPDWTKPFPPFKLIGNIYWVGSYDLSTYLITTPQGHFLINTGVGDTARQIKASVEQLGFKMTDVKILTATHGHWDHVAGDGRTEEDDRRLARRLGARQRAAGVRREGGLPLRRTSSSWFEPVKVDRTFKDGETLSLGEHEADGASASRPHQGRHELHDRDPRKRQDLSRRDRQHGLDQPWRDGDRDGDVSRHPAGLRAHVCGAAGDEDRRLPRVTRVAVRDAREVSSRAMPTTPIGLSTRRVSRKPSGDSRRRISIR